MVSLSVCSTCRHRVSHREQASFFETLLWTVASAREDVPHNRSRMCAQRYRMGVWLGVWITAVPPGLGWERVEFCGSDRVHPRPGARAEEARLARQVERVGKRVVGVGRVPGDGAGDVVEVAVPVELVGRG